MRVFLTTSALLGFFLAAPPAWAQGTPQQRAACTDDAYRFCDAQIPDAIAVEQCLRANVRGLSRACRAQFVRSTTTTRRRARHY
jgi:hypothetical protein